MKTTESSSRIPASANEECVRKAATWPLATAALNVEATGIGICNLTRSVRWSPEFRMNFTAARLSPPLGLPALTYAVSRVFPYADNADQ
jgi:hypothetical protein